MDGGNGKKTIVYNTKKEKKKETLTKKKEKRKRKRKNKGKKVERNISAKERNLVFLVIVSGHV